MTTFNLKATHCIAFRRAQVFGASLIDEFQHCLLDMGMSWDEIAQLARNSFQHSALPVDQKLRWCERIEAWRREITPREEEEVAKAHHDLRSRLRPHARL